MQVIKTWAILIIPKDVFFMSFLDLMNLYIESYSQ